MKNKMNIVIKIGGSLLFSKDNSINSKTIKEFCQIIKEKNKYEKIVIVCGGGIIARAYINAVRAYTKNEALCDIFGIEISRINAKLLITALRKEVYPLVPRSIEDLSVALLNNRYVILGGLQPGQSTTSVALEVAEYIGNCKVVILTDVDGIYDKDPKIFKDAKLLNELNYQQLQEIILNSSKNNQAAAGEYRIFDAVSLQILKRSKIEILITSGIKLNDFRKYWNANEDINGTFIKEN